MLRCKMCKEQEATTAWHPFGPAENCRDGDAFTALGHHYRGFAVVVLCWDCQGEIQNGEHVTFDYKGDTYQLIGELPPEKQGAPDVWDTAIESAIQQDTLLRASELNVHMIVRRVNGDRDHRVIEVLTSPDGFVGIGIARTLDDRGYDHTWVFQANGLANDAIWQLLGIYQPGDPWAAQKTV